MNIRLIERGWENYTGMLCGADFVEGVAKDVTARQAAMVANIIQTEKDDGSNPSDSQNLIDSQCIKMVENMPVQSRYNQPSSNEGAVKDYTREELEKIASDKGILGLREVGNTVGVRADSIVKLIEAVIDAQKKRRVEAEQGVTPTILPVKDAKEVHTAPVAASEPAKTEPVAPAEAVDAKAAGKGRRGKAVQTSTTESDSANQAATALTGDSDSVIEGE